MGLIKNLLTKKFLNYSLADFDRDIKAFTGGWMPSNSGVNVNERTAMRHITVASCIRVRSESFASLPLSIYRRRSNGRGRDEVYDHPLYDLIHAVPNPDMTSMTWRETSNMHLDLSGNCYSVIIYDYNGKVKELYPLNWWEVEPRRDIGEKEIIYHIRDRGKSEALPSYKIFHVPGFAYDGLKGASIIRLASEAVGMGMALSEFTARFFAQGMNVGGILETPNVMKQENVDELREAFENRGAGLANSWRHIVLNSGLTYKRIPMPLEDVQALEIMRLNIEQICGLYRVPPHMIAELSRSTNNNIEHQGIEYVQYSMLPIITRWEQVMNWKLFTPRERTEGYYVKFNVDALLRGDAAARAQYLNTKRQNGIINANEWRELDDENPIEGVVGEAYLVNGAMISVENVIGQQKKAGEPDGKN
jgi:HK97 family phage portal protein